MTPPNDIAETTDAPVDEGPTNMYGGDTVWEEPELDSNDRGDVVDEPSTENDAVATTDEQSDVQVEESDDDVSPESTDEDEASDVRDDSADTDDSDTIDPDVDTSADDVPVKEDVPDKGSMVPRNRLNKEIDKRKASDERIKALESQLENSKPEAEAKVEKVEDSPAFTLEDFTKMQDAMLDGEAEEAMGMFSKMMEAQSAKTAATLRTTVLEEARQEIKFDKENTALQASAVELGARYPELDSGSDDADQGLIEDVVATRDIYVERGFSPSESLEKAVSMIVRENELVDRKQIKSIAEPVSKKKPSQIKKKIEIAKKEQGVLDGGSAGDKNDKINLLTMSDEQFSKVSTDALRVARGDFL